jgi:AcrR family transcriptional regulator
MKRIVKDPEERRQEIIDTSEVLFERRGYENTTIDDIAQEMHVAKGLLYYYFESKEAILDVAIERFVEAAQERLHDIADAEGHNAVEKMSHVSQYLVSLWKKRRGLADYLHEERNEYMHCKLAKRIVEKISGPIAQIIRQGVAEGVFTAKYPDEAAVVLVSMGDIRGEGVSALKDLRYEERIERTKTARKDIAERILGARPGSFDVFDEG